MGNIDEEGAGGHTSSNPQILLGAEEGGLLSVEYVRRAMAGGEKGSWWDCDPYLAVTTSGEW